MKKIMRSYKLFIISLIILLISSKMIIASDTLDFKSESSSDYEGLIIDSILIENRNVFDTEDEKYQGVIYKMTNKLHVKTAKNVIKRELLLKVGDLYSEELAEESERIIRQRLVVYDAWINKEILPGGNLKLTIVTIDQWSLAGGFDFAREGNETTLKIGAEEKNLLGSNRYLSFYYINQSDENNYIESAFVDRRFMGKPFQLELKYNNNPLNSIEKIIVGRPYYNLSQSVAYSFILNQSSGRHDQYNNSVKIASSYFQNDQLYTEINYRTGNNKRKLTYTLSYYYQYKVIQEKMFLSPDTNDILIASNSFPDDSTFHSLGAGINYSDYDYIQLRQIDGFNFTEDFSIGKSIQVDFRKAYDMQFDNFVFNRLGLAANVNLYKYNSLLSLNLSQFRWFDNSVTQRRLSALSLRYYKRLNHFFTFASRLNYIEDNNINDSDYLLLGGTTGIRGFDKFYKTGQEKAVINIEGRFFTGLNFMSMIFGGVVFADWGNIWRKNEPVKLQGFNRSLGAGLRIAFDKTSHNVVRIDFAYTDNKIWQISLGTGQYFNAGSIN